MMREASEMRENTAAAEVNIHLRARTRDRAIIDQAAELVGANRSQFMLASAFKEAKNILLDQSTIHADTITQAEAAGMRRMLQGDAPWARA